MSDEFTILSTTNVEVKPSRDLAHIAKVPRLRFADTYGAVGDYGIMNFQELKLPWLTIWYSHYLMRHPTVIRARIEQPILEGHITLKNQMAQSLGKSTNTLLDSGEFNVTYTPFVENKAYFAKGGEYVTFDIHPNQIFLENCIPDFPDLENYLNLVGKGPSEALSLFKHRSFLSPEMELLVKKIIYHQCSSDATKSYTHALSIELFLLFLLRVREAKTEIIKPRSLYTEEMLYIRELLKQQAENYDFEDRYDTVIDLAQKVGLSLYKMRQAFKQTFGIDPYQMLMDFRFEKARKFLLDTDLSILDIALNTGYQTKEAFCKAYQKRFGVRPTIYRKKDQNS